MKAYELKPDHSYVFICGPKSFSYQGAHALLKHVREHHPNIDIFILGTAKPKDIEVGEKENGKTDTESSTPSS